MTISTTVPPATPTRPRLVTAALLRLLLADFAAMCSFYLLLPVVGLYAERTGHGGLGAGLSTAVLMFASVAAELLTPRLAARIGYRRLLMLGLVLLGVPALALPAVTDLGALMAVCVLRGVGFAIVVVAVGALAAAAVPADRRGEGMGLLGVVSMLPAVVALPLGVWLVPAVGFGTVFVAGAAVAVLAVPAVLGLPEGTVDAAESQGIAAVLRNPALAGPALLFAATAVAGGAVVAFLPAAMASADLAATALLVQSATATAARWLAGRHADRHGPRRLLVPGAVLCAVGMAAAVATGSGVAVLAGMALFGAGFGVVQSASMNLMLARVPREEYGTVSAAWNVAYDLGWGAGAAGIGMIVAAAGYPVAFAAAAVVVLAAVPLARLGAARRTTD